MGREKIHDSCKPLGTVPQDNMDDRIQIHTLTHMMTLALNSGRPYNGIVTKRVTHMALIL